MPESLNPTGKNQPNPDRPDPEENLPAAELDVLAALSRIEPATAAVLREELEEVRPMGHGSVLTLLKRLEAKGLVDRNQGKVGKAFLYATRKSSTSTFGGVLRGLARRLFVGDKVALVASLFDGDPPESEEIERLRKLLDSFEKPEKRG